VLIPESVSPVASNPQAADADGDGFTAGEEMRMGSSDGDAAVPGGVRPFLASALAGLGPHVIHDERDAPRPVGNGLWGRQTVVSIPVTAEATKRYLSLVVTHRGFPRGTRSAVSDTLTWSLTGDGSALGGTVKASDLHHAWLSSIAGGRTLGGARPFWVIPLGFVADGGAAAGVTVTTASALGEWLVAAVLTEDSQALAGVGGRFVAAGAGVPENALVSGPPTPWIVPPGSRSTTPFSTPDRPIVIGPGTNGSVLDTDEDFSPDLEEMFHGTDPAKKESAPYVLSSQMMHRHTFATFGSYGTRDPMVSWWYINRGWTMTESLGQSPFPNPESLGYRTWQEFEQVPGIRRIGQYLTGPAEPFAKHGAGFVDRWNELRDPTPEHGLPRDGSFPEEIQHPITVRVPYPTKAGATAVQEMETFGFRYRLRGPLTDHEVTRQFLRMRWEQAMSLEDYWKTGIRNWPESAEGNSAITPEFVGIVSLTISPQGTAAADRRNYSKYEDIIPKPKLAVSDRMVHLVAERLFPVDVAVDANRDGKVEFGADTTSAEKPYQFWTNVDRDIGHKVDIAPPPLGHIGDREEDDVDASEKAAADADESGIKFLRDLEDFSRVWIDYSSLVSLFPAADSAVQMKVRMESIAGSPSVTLYQPVEIDGGREYLKSESTGNSQLQGVYGQELCAATTVGVEVPKRAWQTLAADNVIHLLFEGKTSGKGKLIFEVHKAGQLIAALPPIYLDLKSATEMYETWTVGDVISPEITNENNNYSVWPDATAQPVSGQGLPAPTTPEEKDYVMFVHGWNMPPHEKTFYADTMFKRLWHQGFKGRFGAYRWPTFWIQGVLPEVNNFNGSEHRAWASGAPLAALLEDRAQVFNVGGISKVRLFGHSMGNVVCSEALRNFGPAGAPVQTYISGQAALAAHCWDPANPRWMNMGLQWSNTANVYRGYWQAAAGADAPQKWEADGRPSYMHSGYMPGNVHYVNHHNVDDWALNSWEINQKWKPSALYHYGWVPNNPFFSADRFYRHFPTELPQTLYCPGNRFEIFSWAAEARSYATGAEPATGGVFSASVDLTAAPFNFDNKHKGHSAQFRSFIQNRWTYWSRFLDDCQISFVP
jgi:hypothetical protein